MLVDYYHLVLPLLVATSRSPSDFPIQMLRHAASIGRLVLRSPREIYTISHHWKPWTSSHQPLTPFTSYELHLQQPHNSNISHHPAPPAATMDSHPPALVHPRPPRRSHRPRGAPWNSWAACAPPRRPQRMPWQGPGPRQGRAGPRAA